jgi:hypothetical protein
MVRALRWISLLATAVPLGATVAHVMELPNKLSLDGPLWLAVQQNLYRGWGRSSSRSRSSRSCRAGRWHIWYAVDGRPSRSRSRLHSA